MMTTDSSDHNSDLMTGDCCHTLAVLPHGSEVGMVHGGDVAAVALRSDGAVLLKDGRWVRLSDRAILTVGCADHHEQC